MRRLVLALMTALSLAALCSPAGAQQLVTAGDWAQYKSRFLERSGRIVDNGNGGISHSEGQGYGMLLAYLAGSPADFEQIWYFTKTELLLRDDGLAIWKWDPKATPRVTDTNNASDGDILIAYALALAGAAWHRMDYVEAAARIAQGVLAQNVIVSGGRTLLLPGAKGFRATDRNDGPVVNPSYWIFEALPVMRLLVPSDKWDRLAEDGIALLNALQIGPAKMPPEWASMQRQPKSASGFDPQFSYNAIRIPLYLVRAGVEDPVLLGRLQSGMTNDRGIVSIIDLPSGRALEPLNDPGYQIVNHIVACVLNGTRLPPTNQQFAPMLYYPSTLQLLGLAFVREKYPTCL